MQNKTYGKRIIKNDQKYILTLDRHQHPRGWRSLAWPDKLGINFEMGNSFKIKFVKFVFERFDGFCGSDLVR